MPSFESDIPGDVLGDLWVRGHVDHACGCNDGRSFASSGRLIGTVEIPACVELPDAGQDYVLGLWRNELEVE